jgi:hypothetical protein
VSGCDRIEDGRGLGILDIDLDGDLDFVMNNYMQQARLLVNHAPVENHWVRLRLEGTKSNRSAVGARVVLYHGAKMQIREVTTTAGYLSGQSLSLHLGLGLDSEIDRMMVHWPCGLSEEFKNLPTNGSYTIVEGVQGPRLVIRDEAN